MPHLAEESHPTALIVGASRGLGRGIATAIAATGTPVVAVARTPSPLAELVRTGAIRTELADARDPSTAGRLLNRHEPHVVILVAGASPVIAPLQHQTWATFSVNWHSDVKVAFHWVRAALLRPLPPGSRMIVISSGAALNGSPLSGGYAGAKSTQRFITAYAQDESDRAELGISFTAVLPRITPLTDLGRPAVEAYAARNGQTEEQYLAPFGAPLTPEKAGDALVELLQTNTDELAPEYLLSAAGLQALSRPASPPAAAPPTEHPIPLRARA